MTFLSDRSPWHRPEAGGPPREICEPLAELRLSVAVEEPEREKRVAVGQFAEVVGEVLAPSRPASGRHGVHGLAEPVNGDAMDAAHLLPVSYTHLTLPTKRIV